MFSEEEYFYSRVALIINDLFDYYREKIFTDDQIAFREIKIDNEEYCSGQILTSKSSMWDYWIDYCINNKDYPGLVHKQEYKNLAHKSFLLYQEWPNRFEIRYKKSYLYAINQKNGNRTIVVLRNQNKYNKTFRKFGTSHSWKVIIFKNGNVRFHIENKIRWLSLKNWHSFKQIGPDNIIRKLFALKSSRQFVEDSRLSTNMPLYVSNKLLSKYSNIKELFKGYTGSKVLFNKNIHLQLAKILGDLPEPVQEKFLTTKICKELMSTCIYSVSPDVKYNCISLFMTGTASNYWLVSDSMRLCNLLNKEFNYSIRSEQTLKIYHDTLLAEYNEKADSIDASRKLKIHEKFRKLQSTEQFEAQLIDTYLSLRKEGQELHHCVGMYDSYIDDGKCAIYSIKYQKTRYTLELKEQDEKIVIGQLRGTCNIDSPDELKQLILQQLRN